MKRFATLASVTLAVLALSASSVQAADVEGFESTWKAAQAKAEKANKPIYAHFTTTWCGWCRRIEDDTYASEKGKEALKDFVAVSLDCTVPRGEQPKGNTLTNIQLMQKYGGSGYPFLVMTTPDGTLLHSFSGYVQPDQFQAEAQRALKAWKTFKGFREYEAKADKSSMEYNVKALNFYADVKNFEKASEPAKKILKAEPKHELALKAQYVLFMAMSEQGKEDQARKHFQKLKELDPKNEKGLLEQAVWAKADQLIVTYRQAEDESQAKQVLSTIADRLKTLAGEEIELEDPVRLHYILGNVYNMIEKTDQAVKHWKTALGHNPPGRLQQEIQRRIDQNTDSE